MPSPSDTLADEQQLMSSLLALMQREQEFLVAADAVGLGTITPEKAQSMNQLAILANQRHQALGAAGFAAEETGMQAWVESPAGQSEADAWQQLLKLTRDAKELNRVNGMLINKQMAHNQGLINAMRQPANAAETTVYGPGGLTTQGGPSRRFVVG